MIHNEYLGVCSSDFATDGAVISALPALNRERRR
jgi:hypothetical protein